MGGRVNVSAVLSLRAQALIATGLGLAVLAGLVAFDNYDLSRLISAQTELQAVRQLDADNHALVRTTTDADAALLTYTKAVATTNAPGAREELLADYLQMSASLTAAQDKVDHDAAAAGMTAKERPVRGATAAWQAWSKAARLAAESHPAPGQPGTNAAEGQALLSAFQSAEASFTQTVQDANTRAEAILQQRSAAHLRVFYGGFLVEALAIALLALAVVNGLLNPIGRLTGAAKVLAEGRPTRVPFIEREDEVGSLARALAAWQQAAADVARVFERSPLGMARLAPSGVVLDANPSLRRMLGGAELVGRPYQEILEPGRRAEFTGLLGSLDRGTRDSCALETRHLSPGRTAFWGNLTLASVPASDETGMAYALLMLEDVDLRKNQELELAHRAAHDPLTGLPNRILFHDRLDQALRAAKRRRGQLAVLLIDLDRFKPVNDELGHHAGDRLLQQVGARMRGCFREADTVARIGGDEFAVVLDKEGREGAVSAARKLLDTASTTFDIDGVTCSVGLSIGIATFPADAASADGLLRRADVAMYQAKRAQSGYHLAAGEPPTAAAL
jgi:diguanylate cyclase (GGDEF)-like protein/PAS domain S-box-containing protein